MGTDGGKTYGKISAILELMHRNDSLPSLNLGGFGHIAINAQNC